MLGDSGACVQGHAGLGGRPMKLFLNAGFGSPLGKLTLDAIAGFGWAGIRQDVSTSYPHEIDALVSEFAGHVLEPLFLVGSDNATLDVVVLRAKYVRDACQLYGLPCVIEVTNEPDASAMYKDRPQYYADVVRAVASELRSTARVIAGGMCSTSKRSLAYLDMAEIGLPLDCTIGIHTYRSTKPDEPLPGYSSRDDEMATLIAIADGRPIWGTEVGWHDAKRSWWPCSKRLTEEQVLSNLLGENECCARAGFEVMTVYQLNDGPGRDPLDHFGIRRIDGQWKQSASLPRMVSNA